jgi:threonine/homoserine/homoserine lactone efflux protein
MMESLLAVLSIAGAITLGAISPGPSFVLVARTSVARSRTDALAMALAMGVPFLYGVLKVVGGAYLVYLGWGLWRHAAMPILLEEAVQSSARSFWLGLATQMSNPSIVARGPAASWACSRSSSSSRGL